MKFTQTISALGLVAGSFASAIPRGAALAPTTNIFQVSQNGTQFENLAVRPDGSILATRIDIPEIWVIEPFAKEGRPLVTIPGDVAGVLGITELYEGMYAVNAGNVTNAGIIAGSFQVWQVDLRGRTPRTSLITKIPEAGLLNGIATLNPETVLTADSNPGRIWSVNVRTGKHSVVIDESVLALPANSTSPAGVNGLRISGEYVYFTNTAQEFFGRVRINGEGTPVGYVQFIAGGFSMDDFTVLPDGTAFLVTGGQNVIKKVLPDGTVTTVAGMADSIAVGGGTSCQFGKTPRDRKILYVTTSGDRSSPIDGTLMEPAKVAAVDLARCF